MPRASEPPKSPLTTESMTILFSDIKNYTQMSSILLTSTDQTLLHTYLDEMSTLIRKHHGTIDKILGDGILALFGQPSPSAHHAQDAVSCALKMQEAISVQATQWRKLNKHLCLEVRMGIATGEVLVGDLTVTGHRNYTALGNTVNLAFRLQEKAAPGSILLSEETYLQIHRLFPCRSLRGLELKGFEDSYDAYEVLGRSAVSPESLIHDPRSPTVTADQRLTPRKSIAMDIEYSINGTSRIARSLNVSEGGIFLCTPELQPIGTTLALHASVPTERGILPLQVRGQVVRHGHSPSGPGVGIRFSSIEASDFHTLRYFIKSIYGLTGSATERITPETEEIHINPPLADPGPNLPGLSHRELGCGDSNALGSRLAHEFNRTKRYNHEFSCIALRITSHNQVFSLKKQRDTLGVISEEILRSVRNTDEVFYLDTGIFVVLAPETMKNRVETLSRRISQNLLRVAQNNPSQFNDLEIRCGNFSFDGRNAQSHDDILTHVLDDCHYSSVSSDT